MHLPNGVSNALANFKEVKQRQQEIFTDCYVGIGTIMNKNAAERFINAGASFIIAPHYSPTVAEVCLHYNKPYIPGCITVKEIAQAMKCVVV